MNKKRLFVFILMIMIGLTSTLVITNVDIEAKTSKIIKNKSGKITKKIHYYKNGNTKQILTYKYYKSGNKKQTVSKRYYKENKKLKWYAKYKYKNSKRKVYKSKLMKKYNSKGIKKYEKDYRYNVYSDNLDKQANIYRYKEYDKGLLKLSQTLYVNYKSKLKVYKYVDDYRIENGKNVKYRDRDYKYYQNKKNKYSRKRVEYIDNPYIVYIYTYNKNGELKSNKHGNAYKYIHNNNDYTIITYKYDKNGKAIYVSGPDEMLDSPL